ncbi:hypothetical protein L218DRAFT_955946 [Marasmius fiardii PR-910]|nr:hypothetical protein L218DRAFT_955946 [Marasmius fiardii PR-910]
MPNYALSDTSADPSLPQVCNRRDCATEARRELVDTRKEGDFDSEFEISSNLEAGAWIFFSLPDFVLCSGYGVVSGVQGDNSRERNEKGRRRYLSR